LISLWFALSVDVVFSEVCSTISFVIEWSVMTVTGAFEEYSVVRSFLAAYTRQATSSSEGLYCSLALVKQRLRNITGCITVARMTEPGFQS
jgi:hypothetical protein